jgi:hypothetical protein
MIKCIKYIKCIKWIFLATALGTVAAPAKTHASEFFSIVKHEAQSELWLNPGMFSYHFDRDRSFNSRNLGFGAEYRYSSVASFTLGHFHNSYHESSNYIGAYWQPIQLGVFKFGAVAGIFNGYSKTNDGGWFPGLIPALTYEGDLFGFNILMVPSIPDRVAGSLSVQFKFKAF